MQVFVKNPSTTATLIANADLNLGAYEIVTAEVNSNSLRAVSGNIVAQSTLQGTLAHLATTTGLVDQTASRALGTSYQNTSSGIMLVVVTTQGSSGALGQGQISADNTNWNSMQQFTYPANGAYCAYVMLVPPGWYYKVVVSAGGVLAKWYEWR